MLTVDQFVARFPEFAVTAESHPALVTTVLAEQWLRIDVSVWGARADEAHGLSSAMALASTSFGRQAALITDGGVPIYERQYREARREVALTFGANL